MIQWACRTSLYPNPTLTQKSQKAQTGNEEKQIGDTLFTMFYVFEERRDEDGCLALGIICASPPLLPTYAHNGSVRQMRPSIQLPK